MNLYVHRIPNPPKGLALSVRVTDADGKVVGRVTPEVADWLVRNGTAMDLTEKGGV